MQTYIRSLLKKCMFRDGIQTQKHIKLITIILLGDILIGITIANFNFIPKPFKRIEFSLIDLNNPLSRLS